MAEEFLNEIERKNVVIHKLEVNDIVTTDKVNVRCLFAQPGYIQINHPSLANLDTLGQLYPMPRSCNDSKALS